MVSKLQSSEVLEELYSVPDIRNSFAIASKNYNFITSGLFLKEFEDEVTF